MIFKNIFVKTFFSRYKIVPSNLLYLVKSWVIKLTSVKLYIAGNKCFLELFIFFATLGCWAEMYMSVKNVHRPFRGWQLR